MREGYESRRNHHLLLILEIGFRHLNPRSCYYWQIRNQIEHSREFIDAVFERNQGEEIGDLLQALTMRDSSGTPARVSLTHCARHIANLHKTFTTPFSPRLRQLVVRSVAMLSDVEFGDVGPGEFVELLNHLLTGVDDMEFPNERTPMLLKIIQSPEGVRLAVPVWKLLAELTVSCTLRDLGSIEYNPRVVTSLIDAGEWDRLECWVGVVWIAWPPGPGDPEEDLGSATTLLFRQRPGAILKLIRWMEKWNHSHQRRVIPRSFQQICEQEELKME
jgi:hypothetical protein